MVVSSQSRERNARSGRQDEPMVGLFEFTLKNKKALFRVFFWWEVVDSNHRSRRQRIYSPPHLAALETSPMKLKNQTKLVLEPVVGIEPTTV